MCGLRCAYLGLWLDSRFNLLLSSALIIRHYHKSLLRGRKVFYNRNAIFFKGK